MGISLKIVVTAHTVAIEDTRDGMTHDELVQHFGVHVGGSSAEVLVLHRFHFGVRERRAPAYRQSGGALDEVVGVDGEAHGSSLVRARIIMALTARLSAFFEASRPLWTCLLGGLFDDWRGTGVEALQVGACGRRHFQCPVDSYQTSND